MYKTVSDVKTAFRNKLNEYKNENNLNQSVDTKYSLTVKNLDLTISADRNNRYWNQVAKVSASIAEKGDDFLVIRVNISEKTNYPLNTFINFNEKHFEDIIYTMCMYWKEYQVFKNIKRIFFEFSSYKNDTEVIENVFKKMGLIKLEKANELFGFYASDNFYREKKVDEEFADILFLHEEILKAKSEFPTFVVEANSYKTVLFKIFGNKYHFENENFQINYNADTKEVVLTRTDNSPVVFELKSGVITLLLETIKNEMRLNNLLHPPIKQTKKLLDRFFETSYETDMIEDKIRDLDEKIGQGTTEKEMMKIYEMIGVVEVVRNDFSRRDDNEKVRTFLMDAKEEPFFKENFGDEFKIYRFDTGNYYWFVLTSRKEKKFWLFPTTEQNVPEEAKNLTMSILEKRRKPDVMNDCSDLLKELEKLKSRYDQDSNLRFALDYFNKFTKSEFGMKWKDELKDNQ